MKIAQMTNPWSQLLTQSAELIINSDESKINMVNQKWHPNYKYQLNLVPEPFIGNIEAPIIALNSNPGFDPLDAVFHSNPHVRKIMFDNLSHNITYFYYLSSVFNGSPGSKYWRRLLNPLIVDTSEIRVSKGIFILELSGYHSYKFQNIDLPSQLYTNQLVDESIDRKKIIIIMRGKNNWIKRVPRLLSYHQSGNLLVMNNPQQPYFSRNNLSGYNKVVNLL